MSKQPPAISNPCEVLKASDVYVISHKISPIDQNQIRKTDKDVYLMDCMEVFTNQGSVGTNSIKTLGVTRVLNEEAFNNQAFEKEEWSFFSNSTDEDFSDDLTHPATPHISMARAWNNPLKRSSYRNFKRPSIEVDLKFQKLLETSAEPITPDFGYNIKEYKLKESDYGFCESRSDEDVEFKTKSTTTQDSNIGSFGSPLQSPVMMSPRDKLLQVYEIRHLKLKTKGLLKSLGDEKVKISNINTEAICLTIFAIVLMAFGLILNS